MKRIVAYMRPHKVEDVKSAVSELPITGMTVSEVRGRGSTPEAPSVFGGEQFTISLPLRSKIEIVVMEDLVEEVIETIIEHARTGAAGDGKIFVEDIVDAVRIRTLERGPEGV